MTDGRSVPEAAACPWCGGKPIRVSFMDQWDPIVNGLWLERYRCIGCSDNDEEGWFSVAVRAVPA